MNVDTDQFAALTGEVEQLREDVYGLRLEVFACSALVQTFGRMLGFMPGRAPAGQHRAPRHLRAVEGGEAG